MEIEVKRDGKTAQIYTDEEIHFDNYREVEKQILDEIEAGSTEIVLDLSNVETLYSMTLGMFNNIAAAVARKGGSFALANVNSDVRKVLKATRLDKIIAVK